MKTARATLGSFRQSPRKMRGVANLVRGKKVSEVLINLDFVAKRASAPIKTLISSALANAKALDIPIENLVVKKIEVNGGPIMYRSLPAARGSAHKMRKRTSSIIVELGEVEPKNKAKTKIVVEKKEEVIKEDKPKAKRAVKAPAKK